MNWWKGLKGRVKTREPLKKHTTLRIGGPAKFFIEPSDEDDLKSLISCAKSYKIRISVIGTGSNILACDRALRRTVIKLNAPFFKKIIFKGNTAEAGSGLPLSGLVSRAKNRGFSGPEFLSGIPGTVGGALVMNAGAWGKDIAGLVSKVKVMDYGGRIKELPKKDIDFSYRKAGLEKFIILGATLRFRKKEKRKIRKDLEKYRRQREAAQDTTSACAGSVFKNPPGGFAGRLIELCGLKGRRIGGACISARHANFILNRNNARAADILKLMDLAKKEVKKKFGIRLEPEIKIWR